VIYLDSSALLKLVRPEKETAALQAWRDSLPAERELVTSKLTHVEIVRTLLRGGIDAAHADSFADRALVGVHLLAVTSDVLVRANAYEMRRLGSLDAIHLASADRYRTELTDFVTYDRELTAAAADLGLPVLSPS
jgi:predicted nucleic acid-binding protein